jgi:hypothetical protein
MNDSAPERDWGPPTRAVGRVGAAEDGGGVGVVGRRRCHGGGGGGRLADAPLLPASSCYVLVMFTGPEMKNVYMF